MWTKVVSQKPETNKWVWGYGVNWSGGEVFLDEDGNWRFASSWGGALNGKYCFVEGITHWRYLPSAPTEDKKGELNG